jgi:adenylylsulfate kinase
MIIQFCGLSGSGKTTLAMHTRNLLQEKGIPVELIDGDEYRKVLCADLGFSKEDRNTNIRRLAFVASKLSAHGIVTIICAINPYDAIREEIRAKYPDVKTVYIHCDMQTLIARDTKGLYKKALLPDDHPDKIKNLTGVNDPFDVPSSPDLVIDTSVETIDESIAKLLGLILSYYQRG